MEIHVSENHTMRGLGVQLYQYAGNMLGRQSGIEIKMLPQN